MEQVQPQVNYYYVIKLKKNRNICSLLFNKNINKLNLYLGCNMSVSNIGVEITSPEYPRPYPKNLHCVTNIRLEEDQKIALRFVKFDLENFWEDW